MPWCKKCNMEYVEGITICPDCGGPLNEEGKEGSGNLVPVFAGKEESARKLAGFLEYSKLSPVTVGEETEHGCPVFIDECQYAEALKLTKIFMQNTSQESEAAEASPEETQKIQKAAAPYVKKADKYEDLHSSAITFLAVGIAGILFMVLNLTGMISIQFGASSYLFYFVMGVLFIGFVIIGFKTFKSAKQVRAEICAEADTTAEIHQWFLSNYTGASIDQAVFIQEEDMSSELKYFSRTDYIRNELNSHLADLDDSYLEDLTENLYQKLFEA